MNVLNMQFSPVSVAMADQLYTLYCASVGGVAHNGDPLPTWDEFSGDPKKEKQVFGWLRVGQSAVARVELAVRAAVADAAQEPVSKSPTEAAPDGVHPRVYQDKFLRRELDALLQRLKDWSAMPFVPETSAMPAGDRVLRFASRHRSLAITHLEDAIMRLGMDLKEHNEANPGSSPNPYPSSYNPASPSIEPTSEGLKL